MKGSMTSVFPRDGASVIQRQSDRAARPMALILALALALWLAAHQVLVPPALVPASALAGEYSGERALNHLQVIGAEPRTVGSPAQARVREYILEQSRALGLTPATQDTTGGLARETGLFASDLHNILVRIPGTASAPSAGAVGLMAHYDSQPNTPGASDNGAAVAGILETMRAIQAGPRLRNDLIFIMTDAEEVDAQGADAFYRQHPWAKDIRLIINFEAAGDGGPSLLMDTSRNNRGLVDAFVQAVPHPTAFSFLPSLLTVIPVGTDMTIFTENGVPGLNPMFGWHYRTVYHSELDSVAALDPRSVQHQGENALGMARYFGNLDLTTLNTRESAVFFTLLPGAVVRYPASLAVPLAILAGLLLAGVIVAGLIRRRLSPGGILAGIAIALVELLVILVVVSAAWYAIARMHPAFWRNIMGAPYCADVYLAGFGALVVAASLALFVLARRKVSVAHLTVGALLIWLALALLSANFLPGMSYVFTWPVLAMTLVLLGLVVRREAGDSTPSWTWLSGLALSGASALLLVVPAVLLLFLLFGFWLLTGMLDPAAPLIALPMLFVTLMLGLMAPQMEALTGAGRAGRRWLAPTIAALLALVLLTAASLTSGFSASQPMQNGVWYEMNADNGQAAWYSFGGKPADPWTAQFFPGAIEPVQLDQIFAATPDNPLLPDGYKGPAPVAPLPAPELTVLSDLTSGSVRTLSLHVSSPRLARGLRIKVSGAPVLSAEVNGNRQTNPGWADRNEWFLRYYGMTGKGVDLVLMVKPSQELTLAVADQSDGLPLLPGVTYAPRRPDMMPFAMAQEYMPYTETASVSKTFRLP